MSASQETPYTADWLRGALAESKQRSTSEDPVIAPGGRHKLYQPPVGLGLSDGEIREVVNGLRRIALEYGGSQQLRERLASYITPILRGDRRP